ncbi:hypothetical protein EJD97_000824 [Solanum chilense]|uniref:Uncharacterized protein n=1 Tax=Solanum chilense TaxID=4083 RepID=A0A6N2C1S3_SOLCI|nr:hypothetical protein EJD97_000824 [Solanum chilense]
MSSKNNVLICLFIFHLLAVVSVSGNNIGIYEIKKGDFSVKVTNYGASIISVLLPDKHVHTKETQPRLFTYKHNLVQNDKEYFGALLGRVANRIGGAQFTLDGTVYKLVSNEGNSTIQGGSKGFSKVVWKVSKHVQDGPCPYITLTYHSPDGKKVNFGKISEQGNSNYNLSHHPYWNIGGHNSGYVLAQVIQIFASHITPDDKQHIPTGVNSPVKNTPYDFLKPRKVGSRINKLQNGYDMNYALDSTEKMKPVAIVYDKKSGDSRVP